MSLLNTQLQNVNVKTLQLRHFCVSHFPAFNLYLVTTSQDIFEEDSIPFNQFGFCIKTATFKQRLGWFLSVGDYDFQFECDELNALCAFLNVKAPTVASELPTNPLCTLCMNNFTSQTVCKECDSALKLAGLAGHLLGNKLLQALRG